MKEALLRTTICLAAAVTPACLLYTDPVNEAPRVLAISDPGEVHFGGEPLLTAIVTDDQDNPTLEWAMKDGPCTASWPDDPQDVATVTAYRVPARNKLGKFCVWARARDRYGAVSDPPATLERDVTNRAPSARVEVLLPIQMQSIGGYRLQSRFRISGATSDDPDGTPLAELAFQWRVTGPLAYTSNEGRCADAPDDQSLLCFTATAPGNYTVALVVTDPNDTSSPTVERNLAVNVDQKPCLNGTLPTTATPIVLGVGESRSLQVTWVDDDLDPWPAGPDGAATLRWWMRRKVSSGTAADAWELIPGNWSQLDIPGTTFDSGDVDICVEAFDRVTGQAPVPPQPSCDAEAAITGCPAAAIWKLSYR